MQASASSGGISAGGVILIIGIVVPLALGIGKIMRLTTFSALNQLHALLIIRTLLAWANGISSSSLVDLVDAHGTK